MPRNTMFFIDGGYVRDKLGNHGYPWEWNIGSFALRVFERMFPVMTQGEDHIRTYYYDANYNKDDPNYDPNIHLKKYDKSKAIFEVFEGMENVEVVLESRVILPGEKDRQKGVDTRMAIDMISKAHMGHYDIAILFCGDKDFIPIVKAVKNLTGKRVFGVYFKDECPWELLSIYDMRLEISKSTIKRFLFHNMDMTSTL